MWPSGKSATTSPFFRHSLTSSIDSLLAPAPIGITLKNLKIWFDIANYYRIDPKVGQLIQKLKNYIYYIHCKNYIIDDSGIYYVELGKGIINFKTLIHEIREHFINLIFSLEVHEKELDKKAEVVRKSYLTLSEYIDGD